MKGIKKLQMFSVFIHNRPLFILQLVDGTMSVQSVSNALGTVILVY